MGLVSPVRLRLSAVALVGAILTSNCAGRAPRSPALEPPLAVSVFPERSLAGKETRITWRIDHDADNRGFCLRLGDWRVTCESLDGANARRMWQMSFLFPPGPHTVVLTVGRADGKTRTATTDLCVYGGDTPCDVGVVEHEPEIKAVPTCTMAELLGRAASWSEPYCRGRVS